VIHAFSLENTCQNRWFPVELSSGLEVRWRNYPGGRSASLGGFHIVTLYFIYTLFQIETKDSGILQAYKMLSMKSDFLCRESDR
jgi:hypothetical protein